MASLSIATSSTTGAVRRMSDQDKTAKPSSSSSAAAAAASIAATLSNLPPEVLDLIGFYSATAESIEGLGDASVGRIKHSSSKVSQKSRLINEDYVNASPPRYATPPSDLRNLLLTCRKVHDALSVHGNPQLYARIFMTKFDTKAIQRRLGRRALRGANLAKELQHRCVCLKRIRKRVQECNLGDAPEEVLENLWLAYMMITENDGVNLRQLRWARLDAYLKLYRAQELLRAAMLDGMPANTPARALALHIDYLLTDPSRLSSESRDEADEKLFILRPYVFAAHRYDAYLAPWTMRQLPTRQSKDAIVPGGQGQTAPYYTTSASQTSNPFMADLRPKDSGMQINYCGQQLSIRAPNITQAACCSFFMKVERDPGVSPPTANAAPARNDVHDDTDDSSSSEEEEIITADGKTTQSGRICTRNPLHLVSKDHDRDVERLLLCTSPTHSPGMKLASHLGLFEGSWEGRFTFFDFDSYRDMLGGRVRSLYEGPFGEQPQVWKLTEHVVRVSPDRRMGGKGTILNSGYESDDEEPYKWPALSQKEVAALQQRQDLGYLNPSVLGKRRTNGESTLNRRMKKMNYNVSSISSQASTPSDDGASVITSDTSSLEEEEESSQADEQYEILLSGTGHSAWGQFVLRGRVRTWDGLVTLTKEYRPDGRGRWLYRGYVLAGNKLVGRWRDTFTPEDMSGYEGCFLLHRRGL